MFGAEPGTGAISHLAAALFLGSARGIGFAVIFPVFTLFQVTGLFAFGVAVALCLPAVIDTESAIASGLVPGAPAYLLLLGKEMLVGGGLGLLCGLPFWAALHGGTLVDHYRGATAPQLHDPTANVEATPFATLFSTVIALSFVADHGLYELVALLWKSYALWPVLSPWPRSVPLSGAELGMLIDILFLRGTLLVGFLLVALAAVDLAFVFVARSASQLPVFELGSAVKNLVALGLLVLAAWFVPAYGRAAFAPFLAEISTLVEGR